ncbi:hypothetical protein GCM10023172_34390 [Hymenobacter ginsengisoli]|uniref:Carboxypeptidase-like regulatory domain-containing protein n=1 Tax=Hymenobacter ginsengisoli TaxID=1051626 RepID=A0ABP8QP59_9BACT|nr:MULTISPECIES: carboxypeptidase-like regulatory domain-containing protein [unclassified Hymenobacter]MBO2031027.1 carboxypeptidase-like regulatory domain-containing protein [Hymenobacter sp. BT559]
MNSLLSVRGWLVLAAPLLAAGLASCSHTPEATAETAAPVAAPAPVAVPVAAPTPVAAEAPKAAPAKVLPKPKLLKPAPAAPASATPAPVVAEAAPAAPAPEPVAAPTPAAPTTHTQAGRVLDESGRPLVGATVLLRGSTKGTSTDANGNYTLEVPSGENTFSVGYGGYQDETATSRDGQPLNVTLLPSPGSKSKKRR